MNQTENRGENSNPAEERIRKIYAKDLKNGETVLTVFRAAKKEKHTSRAGKSYLAITLVDRTGEVDARVFENVDAADGAFAADDFLLVQGKIGSFHGKSQIVIDRLERLDPGPIDAKEFAWSPPPPAAEERPAKAPVSSDEPTLKPLPKRLTRFLSENPGVANALDQLVASLERAIDDRIAAKLGHAPAPRPEHAPRPERPERKPKGPRVEHKPTTEAKPEPKPEPKRDPSLPEGLAFKPFNMLVADDKAQEAAGNSTPGSSEG